MEENLSKLKKIIAERVLLFYEDEVISAPRTKRNRWVFDFRKILMNGECADLISELFYTTHLEEYPLQLAGLETAGIPLATSFMTKFYSKGHTDVNAFFIRKARKSAGVMRMIEGEVSENMKIILVDDTMNTGSSFWKQIEILEAQGFDVRSVWSIVRFRELDYYKKFLGRKIKVESLFTLDEFVDLNGEKLSNSIREKKPPSHTIFDLQWTFKSPRPSYYYITNKSQPILDDEKVFFGSDNRFFWAIHQSDGSVAWKYQVGFGMRKKSIFSNPAFYKNLVIFGSYDGNVYALNKENGKRVWVSYEADWVGSSPAVSVDLGLVFIGLEFGLVNKHGGIVALDANTGKTAWIDASYPAYTHSSPYYIQQYQQVVIGSNDGAVRLYNAKNGKNIWKFVTNGGKFFELNTNQTFSDGDIKESFVYSEKHDYIIFGSMDGYLYVLRRKDGSLVYSYKSDDGIWATPFLIDEKVYFTSLDKHVRCLCLDTFELIFERILDGTRIFGSPTLINDRLYVGTNSGHLHELDPQTGVPSGYFQTLERITNTVVYNAETNTYFLPTYANEVLCLKRKDDASVATRNESG